MLCSLSYNMGVSMATDYRNSKLEVWLKKHGITTQGFADKVGCCRPLLWKVKRGLCISQKYADKISELTGGEVVPGVQNKGRRWS